MKKFKVIDLFAGAGGLSLGFYQTNRCEIKLAFEKSLYMQNTYKKNFSNVEVFGDICNADFKEILKRHGKIDIVIGGPPCQGFSNANRQRNHSINKNNLLIKEYVRAIKELHPDCFLLENVGMLKSDVHRFFLDRNESSFVKKNSIRTKQTNLKLLEKEFVFRGALSIIKDKKRVLEYRWPASHFRELSIVYKSLCNNKKPEKTMDNHRRKLLRIAENYTCKKKGYINKKNNNAFQAIINYYLGMTDLAHVKKSITPAVKIQQMLNTAWEILENDILVDKYSSKEGVVASVRSYSVLDYIQMAFNDNNTHYEINSRVLCAADYGVPQMRRRFIMVGISSSIVNKVAFPKGSADEKQYLTVGDAIKDLEDIEPVLSISDDIGIELPKKRELSCLSQKLRDSTLLMNHVIPKTSPIAMKRFEVLKQGENFHSLDDSLKNNTYSNSSRTQNTIYLRLDYGRPCETVVNVRKSMWIHPTQNRAISIREAARLQTFPDSFVFVGPKDSQYQQIGNAVPPVFANCLAKWIISMLDKKEGLD